MNTDCERILIVESDPNIADFLAHQALEPLGYQVRVAGEAGSAIRSVLDYKPDIIIADLNLPGLSGKDLLVALTAQGLHTPVIGLSARGTDKDIVQAFRLGAVDYLAWPVREAEVVSTVERVIRQMCGGKERDEFTRQLRQVNQELERRVREFTTIFAVGKMVTSITEPGVLFNRIVEAALRLSEADMGWFLLQVKNQNGFILAAQRNLPEELHANLNRVWQDGVSTYSIVSGEAVVLHGEQLKTFPVARLGQAALVVPVKIQKQAAGVLVCMRQKDHPFTTREQNLVEAVADYAAIALTNTRLVQALEGQAQSLKQNMEKSQAGEKARKDLLVELNHSLREPLDTSNELLERLISEQAGGLTAEQRQYLVQIQNQMGKVRRMTASISVQEGEPQQKMTVCDLNELATQAVSRFQRDSQQTRVALVLVLPPAPVRAMGDPVHIDLIFDGLLSNAIRFSPQGGQVRLKVENASNRTAHVTIQDNGRGINPNQLQHLFDQFYEKKDQKSPQVPSGYPNLRRVRQMVRALGGDLWAESKQNEGSVFHFTLRTEDSG